MKVAQNVEKINVVAITTLFEFVFMFVPVLVLLFVIVFIFVVVFLCVCVVKWSLVSERSWFGGCATM